VGYLAGKGKFVCIIRTSGKMMDSKPVIQCRNLKQASGVYIIQFRWNDDYLYRHENLDL
jgi:hypothetical protein